MNLVELYRHAEEQNITVCRYKMAKAESLSMPLSDGTCAIAMDPTKLVSTADETWKLAHELGHCETGSFYNKYAPLDERGRNERRAEHWAIRHVLPFDELARAITSGMHQIWELAEYFMVPEALIREAVDYYTGPCGLTFA